MPRTGLRGDADAALSRRGSEVMATTSGSGLPCTAEDAAALARDLARADPRALAVCDGSGRIVLWNEAAATLYGFPSDAALGRSLETLLGTRHPFGLETIAGELARQGSWSGELFRRDAAGRDVRVRASRQLRLDAGGGRAGFVERSWDEGAEAQAIREAEVTAHRYRNLFHAMAASFWELDFSQVRLRIAGLLEAGVTDLRSHFAAHPEFIDECIAVTGIVDVNETTVTMFAAPDRAAILDAPLGWQWPQESRHIYAGALVAAFERRPQFTAETKLGRRDGTLFDALFTVCWPEDHRGRGTVLVGVIDISEGKAAERRLRLSEERYRNLFDHMPVALSQFDMTALEDWLGRLAREVDDLASHLAANPALAERILAEVRIVEANQETLRLFGVEDIAAVSAGLQGFWSIRPDTILRSLIARLQGAEAFSEETQVLNARGETVDVLYTMAFPTALVERGMNIVGLVDLSERTRAARALRLSETRYRDLFQELPVGLWRLDRDPLIQMLRGLKEDGITDIAEHFDRDPAFLTACMEAMPILEVNAAAARIAGLDTESIVGMTCADFWRDHPEVFRNAMVAHWRGEQGHSEEGVMGTPGNGPVDVAFSVTFPKTPRERDLGVVSTIDIRDRKRAEARLAQVQADFSHAARVATLGELAASIAHEVNQPLTAISAYAQASLRWLQRDRPDVAELRSLSEQIVEDARRAGEVISRIRRMAVKRVPSPEEVDLNEVVDEALLVVSGEASRRRVKVVRAFAGDLPAVLGDRVQLQQVVVNLALNAIQAMEDCAIGRSVLTVSTHRDGAMVTVTVADTGPGIAPDAIDHVFTGFYTTKEEGMGIGLAICRSIVETGGGSIRAFNSGRGATFRFTLPVAP